MNGLLSAQVHNIFKVIETVDSDLTPRITYLEAAFSTYDPSTRQYSGGFCAHENVICVRAGLTDEDSKDSEIVSSTAKFLIAKENLPDVTPKIQDRIMDEAGQHYSIIKSKTVPSKSLWILFCIETDA